MTISTTGALLSAFFGRFVCPRPSPNGTGFWGRPHVCKVGSASIFRLQRKPSWSSWRFLRPSFWELSLEVGWRSSCARASQALESRNVWDCDGGHGGSRGVVVISQLVGYEELSGCQTMSPARLDLWSLTRRKPSSLILAVKPTQWLVSARKMRAVKRWPQIGAKSR